MSAAVLVGIVAYVVLPTRYSLKVTHSVHPTASSSGVVISSSVRNGRGEPLPNVTVELRSNCTDNAHAESSSGPHRHHHTIVCIAAPSAGQRRGYSSTGPHGTSRVAGVPPGDITVTVTTDRHGGLAASTRFRALPGTTYEIDAVLRSDGSAFFAPISTY